MLSSAAMRTSFSFASLLVASSLTAGCLGPETDTDTETVQSIEQQATDPLFRVHNIVEAVLPAANYDGVAGNECIALVNPEHRLRKIIIFETAGANGACALNAYSAGSALSFTWGDTSVYQGPAGIASIRAALSDTDGAVHRLTGTLTSEATTLAHLQSFLTQTYAAQAEDLQGFDSVRVHSRYDFEGQEQVSAEAAYQAVRVTQPCENPGYPSLNARVHNGFVYGYTATNTGSCHSGWFTKRHVYNRNWELVDFYEYSE
ncbi:hypothetical protein HUW63_21725 [Myxococcus sp. AM001]|nr:hypothetical protein [Myxococcus sp. AM001]